MNIFPAIDLKENKCVRLVKGDDSTSVVFNSNPVDQAKFFEDQGCTRLHLIDLDSAFGRNNINNNTIRNIRKSISIPIQVGGGIRSEKIIQDYIDLGVNYLIIGSFAISRSEVVKKIAQKYPDSIYVSLDILNKKIMIKGWKEESAYSPSKLFQKYNKSMIRGYILTDIENDGMLSGLNQEMISQNIKLTEKKFIVGGGLKDYSDFEELKKIQSKNLEGVIAGKSFYVGNIDLKKAQKILSQNA